ncbi:ABC transporter substrate-binding protein [Sphingomonas glacialis]|uniref:Hopanoid biosynthesis protein HpnM n=1 Tax=Sphingomonas glacialis TaxID=658225 RepID=A0A502G063_9SPHN|nr:ABC transporter substrate-binding protein [Sphingomonas glacialis]TPG54930.1 hopanoid biosynthesis protein HpnM [Sphingomonas glacialis]
MTTFLRMIVPAAVLAIAAPLSAQAGDPARAPVQTLDDGLLAIMKGGKALGAAGRAARIAPVVDQTFDVPLITRLSVGADWLKVAPADQTALVAAMRRLTVAQYAANFDSYGGESFTINPNVEMRGGDKVVRTTLAAPKGDAVPIDYRMRQSGGSWRIVDVYYKNGISQLATRRADFASIFAKGGAKALISHLNALSAKGGR